MGGSNLKQNGVYKKLDRTCQVLYHYTLKYLRPILTYRILFSWVFFLEKILLKSDWKLVSKNGFEEKKMSVDKSANSILI